MSPESQPISNQKNYAEGLPMQPFMEAEIRVLRQLFGDDDEQWTDWLNDDTEHGERLRVLVAGCYINDKQVFSDSCVAEVIDTLRSEIKETGTIIH